MEKSLGSFLAEKRKEKKLTQKQLAKMLFISESAVSKWEKDVAHPDITMLPKLANILGVTEHEIITASVDEKSREEKSQAKKWRAFSKSWSLFFYIAYSIVLIPCFICNLAIEKTLSWFWIVVSALLLSFTFTNLPKIIKKHKLLILPLSMYGALCLLLGVCCIYTGGDWFWIPAIAVLFAMIIIFCPIYIAKYKVFKPVQKYNDFVSIAIDFLVLNILLLVVECYTLSNGYAVSAWYLNLAFPISLCVYLVLNLLCSVRFLKLNKLLKTGIILAIIELFIFVPPLFIKVKSQNLQKEIDDFNILKADFSIWKESTIDNNVSLIMFISILAVVVAFLTAGLILYIKRKNKSKVIN